MAANKKSSIKLSLLITVFIVISLSGCFSEWQGDLAKVVISFGGAERVTYNPNDHATHQQLKHKIVFTNTAETLNFNSEGNTTFEAYLTPGNWNVKIDSWLGNEIYATGTKDVILILGQDNIVTIRMHQPAGSAVVPSITEQPANKIYSPGSALAPLTVSASVSDGGTLSYQWYSNTIEVNSGGTIIVGATGREYTPTQNVIGNYYYYVVVTNTNPRATQANTAAITSNVARLSIPVPSFNATFTVNTANKFQYVRGFGGMDTPWINELSINNYNKMYHPGNIDDPGNTSGINGLGYNIMKIMLLPWNTDPDTTMTQLIEGPGPAEIDNPARRPNQYEGVKIVNRNKGYVLAAAWSPPAGWKINQSIYGGGRDDAGNKIEDDYLMTARYQDFANYLNAYAKNFKNNNAPIYAIGIQHEPNYSEPGYEGCTYTEEQHLAFWNTVGHFTTAKLEAVGGYGGGINQQYVRTMSGEPSNDLAWLNNVASDINIDIMGRHGYGKNVDSVDAVLAWGKNIRTIRENAGKETWMTEYNINSNSADGYPNDSTWAYVWKFMNNIDLAIRLNKDNAFIWWTAKRFYSMIGDGAYSTTEDVVLPRGYGLSHYAKFAKEMHQVAISCSGNNGAGALLNANNINPTSYNEDNTAAKATAFMSSDGNTISLVMMTPTNTDGSNGQNMGIVRIVLPSGYTIGKVVAMRTTAASPTERNVNNVTEIPIISADRKFAYISLPAGNILSVRFTKQ